eukprot:74627-Chlamydomonas_euryale.AAC.11
MLSGATDDMLPIKCKIYCNTAYTPTSDARHVGASTVVTQGINLLHISRKCISASPTITLASYPYELLGCRSGLCMHAGMSLTTCTCAAAYTSSVLFVYARTGARQGARGHQARAAVAVI